ncbi:MAG: hypothetical protein RLZZ368_985, partial [Actinomycetota bacterium]
RGCIDECAARIRRRSRDALDFGGQTIATVGATGRGVHVMSHLVTLLDSVKPADGPMVTGFGHGW